MHVIDTAVDIAAEPLTVWGIVTNLAAYREWNPFVIHAAGELTVGGKLTLGIRPAGGRTSVHRPTVVALEPGRLLRWHGRVAIPGLLDARHELSVEPHDGGTRLGHREEFRGLLVPFLRGTLRRTEEGFHLMNTALRERAEHARPDGG
ncbi:MAG TPA: SRPBCC domain-containing protein [Pseudonocardiaceae bacterium]